MYVQGRTAARNLSGSPESHNQTRMRSIHPNSSFIWLVLVLVRLPLATKRGIMFALGRRHSTNWDRAYNEKNKRQINFRYFCVVPIFLSVIWHSKPSTNNIIIWEIVRANNWALDKVEAAERSGGGQGPVEWMDGWLLKYHKKKTVEKIRMEMVFIVTDRYEKLIKILLC